MTWLGITDFSLINARLALRSLVDRSMIYLGEVFI